MQDSIIGHALAVTQPARLAFAPEQAKIIKDTVARECTEAEFHFFLEVSARYDLNPMLGEMYAMKIPGKNGGPGRVVPTVGRNGWLKVARRHDDFLGMDGDVVREKDIFKIKREGGKRVVSHEYEGSDEMRGPIKGAWCEVYRAGYPPTYFYAPLSEYKPTSPAKLQFSPWSSQESVMMLKCAQVTALRLTYNMAGVYDEAEMGRIAPVETHQTDGPQIEWGEDQEIALWLQALVKEANKLRAGSWLPERVRLKLEGTNEEGKIHVGEEIAAFIKQAGGEVPSREIIEEAEVVQ